MTRNYLFKNTHLNRHDNLKLLQNPREVIMRKSAPDVRNLGKSKKISLCFVGIAIITKLKRN